MDTIFFFVSIVKTIVSIVVKQTPPALARHDGFARALASTRAAINALVRVNLVARIALVNRRRWASILAQPTRDTLVCNLIRHVSLSFLCLRKHRKKISYPKPRLKSNRNFLIQFTH